MSETPDNNKPAKAAAGAVIRRMTYGNEEDSRERMLKRQVPAWVISGAVHVVLIAMGVLLFKNSTIVEAVQNDSIVETAIEEAEEPDKNLTNPDLGFDAELDAATEADREEPENVEAPVVPEEPIGAPTEASELPIQTVAPPGSVDVMQNAGTKVGPDGMFKGGDGGAGGAFVAPGMKGRSGATKDRLLAAGGGNTESEAAVALGLIWLAKQQKPNGSWIFDQGSEGEIIAATGMSLLPFLAAGQTHKVGKYTKEVYLGLMYITSKQTPKGTFTGGSGMYAHAIGTVALCEAYGMSLDPNLKKPAQAALNYIMGGQGKNGSWGYSAGGEGDTSIVGWQIQALKSGKLAGLVVADEVMKKANYFLDKVGGGSGETYGYTEKGASRTLTPVGLLCRQYISGWGPKNPILGKGIDFLMKFPPVIGGQLDMYYYYYATQVVHFYGGPDWTVKWNPKMRDWLIGLQNKPAGPNRGSWDPDAGIIGSQCGRLGTTCLCLLTLEVYYRHLPLYKRDNGGLNELDR